MYGLHLITALDNREVLYCWRKFLLWGREGVLTSYGFIAFINNFSGTEYKGDCV